jgi:hypothetical protein
VSAARWCRTPEDAYQAGLEHARAMPPLTDEAIERCVAILAPRLYPGHENGGPRLPAETATTP